RSSQLVSQVKGNGHAQDIYQQTWMPPHPMAPVYKLLWIKEKNPKLFTQVQKWIGIKEYIIWRLTGKIVTDTTMAAGTGLLNLHTLTWDRELLDKIEIDRVKLTSFDKRDYIV